MVVRRVVARAVAVRALVKVVKVIFDGGIGTTWGLVRGGFVVGAVMVAVEEEEEEERAEGEKMVAMELDKWVWFWFCLQLSLLVRKIFFLIQHSGRDRFCVRLQESIYVVYIQWEFLFFFLFIPFIGFLNLRTNPKTLSTRQTCVVDMFAKLKFYIDFKRL